MIAYCTIDQEILRLSCASLWRPASTFETLMSSFDSFQLEMVDLSRISNVETQHPINQRRCPGGAQ